ncbi:MAG TPA: class I SAM-dependent methyltransferase [Phycisphaerales bacterium]|nr:class I SAM-dependent methyltransferase [Phycisphaerales bacterium]
MSATTLSNGRVASNESLCLPPEYRQQAANFSIDTNRDQGSYWAPWRLADNGKWQHHVYRWAAELMASEGLTSVLDVGCGPCVKLLKFIAPLTSDITGLDQPSALEAGRRQGAAFTLASVDLENPQFSPGRTYDLIICADVIEHLADPEPAIGLFRRCAGPRTLLLISTPERSRERGRACMASNKPEHVREWTREEFERFLRSRGLTPRRHRLLPKDAADREPLRQAELEYRLGRAPTSPLCCQAWVCTLDPRRG